MRWLLVALAPCACQAIVGVRDRSLAASDAGAVSEAAPAPPSDAPTCVDTKSDPNNCGFCGRACASCTDGMCPVETIPIAGCTFARAMAVAANVAYVGCQEGLTAFDLATRSMKWRAATGAVLHVVFANGALWVASFSVPNGRLSKVDLGGNVTSLRTESDTAAFEFVAVDAAHVYWVNGRAGVARVALDGTGYQVLRPDPMNRSVGLDPEIGVTNDFVFVGDASPSSDAPQIVKIDKNGAGTQAPWLTEAWNGLAVRDERVYFGTYAPQATMKRASLDATVDLLALLDVAGVHSITTDRGRLYATTFDNKRAFTNDGVVIAIDIGTGVEKKLATGLDLPIAITVDGDSLVWLNGAAEPTCSVGRTRR